MITKELKDLKADNLEVLTGRKQTKKGIKLIWKKVDKWEKAKYGNDTYKAFVGEKEYWINPLCLERIREV